MPRYYHLFIINKHGGLMYSKNFEKTKGSDDMLIAAASFHGIDALSTLLTPPSIQEKDSKNEHIFPTKTQLQTVVAESFKLHCYETLTGAKFVLIAELAVTSAEAKTFLKQLYEAFADYVLKDPFFVPEQLVKNKNFEKALQTILESQII